MGDWAKVQKTLKNDMLLLSILEIIIVIFAITQNSLNIPTIVFAASLFAGYFLAKSGKAAAGTIGIIVGILMALTIIGGDIIDFLLGIFLIKHSSNYNKFFK